MFEHGGGEGRRVGRVTCAAEEGEEVGGASTGGVADVDVGCRSRFEAEPDGLAAAGDGGPVEEFVRGWWDGGGSFVAFGGGGGHCEGREDEEEELDCG